MACKKACESELLQTPHYEVYFYCSFQSCAHLLYEVTKGTTSTRVVVQSALILSHVTAEDKSKQNMLPRNNYIILFLFVNELLQQQSAKLNMTLHYPKLWYFKNVPLTQLCWKCVFVGRFWMKTESKVIMSCILYKQRKGCLPACLPAFAYSMYILCYPWS